LKFVFKNTNGQIRSGWVALTFAVFVVSLGLTYSLVLSLWNIPNPKNLADPNVIFSTLGTLLAGIGASLLCLVIFKVPHNFRHPKPVRELALGALLSLILMSLSALTSALVGRLQFHFSIPDATVAQQALVQFVTLAPAGIGEELVMRGLVFQLIATRFHTSLALCLTGIIFGFAHLANPNASLFAAANIALVGLLFGLITLRTGSLLRAVGLHVMWNYTEGFLLGLPVSGVQPKFAWSQSTWAPADFFSGGNFGPEASGMTTVVLTAACAIEVLLARRWPRGAAFH
jgi:uncharacterized protein